MSDSLLGTAALNKERQRYIEHLQSENHALRAQLAVNPACLRGHRMVDWVTDTCPGYSCKKIGNNPHGHAHCRACLSIEKELAEWERAARLNEAKWWDEYPMLHSHARNVRNPKECLACKHIDELAAYGRKESGK